MFNAFILAIRSASILKHDFPERIAEAQTRMWRAAGGGFDAQTNSLREQRRVVADPLEMKIRSRMATSHVYDCIWSWRNSIGTSQERR